MKSFFKFKTLWVAFVAVLSMSFAGLAAAQSTLPSSPGVTIHGITVGGWVMTGAVGFGETRGTGQLVTGQVVTMTEERFTLDNETLLVRNDNPGCIADCSDTQSRMTAVGSIMASAASNGMSSNSGTSCGANPCPPTISSMSQTGTNLMFNASLFRLPAPVAPPAAPPAVQ